MGIASQVEPAAAQFVQYTLPGAVQPRREDTATTLGRHIESARWRVGRALIDPWFGARNFGYVDPVAGIDESDFTVTVGAGLRGWLPLGSELTLAAHALPEYVWWDELSERNRWNGRYGAGLFGNLGRIGLELTATHVADARFFSRELEDQVNTREDGGAAKVEIDLGRGLELFAQGSVRSVDYLVEQEEELPNLSAVDRYEDVARVGMGYGLPRGLTLGLGAEVSRARFEKGVSDRSNSGTAPVMIADFEGSRLTVTADLAWRSLRPDGGSRFVDFDGVTGRFQASWRTLGRLELQLFGGNDLVYSFTSTWAYFEDRFLGIGVRGGLTDWVRTRVFVETGDDDFTPFEAEGLSRTDDFDSWGLEFEFLLERLALQLGWWQTDYASSLSGFDRRTSSFRSSVSFGLGSGVSWD